MRYDASRDPFLITEKEGVKHAVKGNIKVSILPDIENSSIKHKVVCKPFKGSQYSTRILKVEIDDIKIFVNNDNFVITKKEIYPRVEEFSLDWCVKNIFKYAKVEKDEKGRYIFNTENNREVIEESIKAALDQQRVDIQNEVNIVGRKILD